MATFNLGRTERALKFAGKALEEALKSELDLQGHVGSGSLLNSIKSRVELDGNGIPQLVISGLEYGLDLDEKQAPKKIQTSVLQKWLETKDLGTNLVTLNRMAYNIGKKIALEGTPTSGASRFSNAPNKRRTGWLTITLEDRIDKVRNSLLDSAIDDIMNIIDKQIKKK